MYPSASRYGQNRRLKWVAIIFIVIALAFSCRLYYLQILRHDFFVKQADQRSVRPVYEMALRGMIIDREGDPLAVSSPVSSIVADPKKLLDRLNETYDSLIKNCPNDETISEDCKIFSNQYLSSSVQETLFKNKKLEELAKLLELDTNSLINDLESKRSRRYYYLKRGVSRDLAEEITNLNIYGISREDGFTRFYPDGELVGKILGFTDVDNHGIEGIEKQYDEWLSGKRGKSKVLIGAGGKKPINVLGEEIAVTQGEDIQLSIDKRIQNAMRREVYRTWEEFKAQSVTAVMVNVKTGEILGMVSIPDGNPNNSSERIPKLMRNHAITDSFEPGSVMKPIAMAAALDAGVISTKTIFPTRGTMRIGKNTVKDTHNYGTLDSTGVIRKSSNIGMALISLKMPRKKYYAFMQKMGFGQLTGVNFPGEQKGILRNPEKINDFDYATTFYGYGISANALQIAQAYATIANNGKKVPLTLLKTDRNQEGVQVISPRVANSVLNMMKTVVAEGGTGTRASTTSYTIAGKTGTAHTVIGKRYAANRYRGLFAGIAPANNPVIAMVIVVEDPKGKVYFGGSVAAPTFSRITESSLKFLNVVPDKINHSGELQFEIDNDIFEDNDRAGLPEYAFE